MENLFYTFNYTYVQFINIANTQYSVQEYKEKGVGVFLSSDNLYDV